MASDQNLILEIEEALKRERTEKIFKEYGPYILAGALLAILFTGIISFYRSYEARVNAQQTGQLMEAMSSADQAKALEELAPQLRPGARAIAYMTAAGALLGKDQNTEAQAIFAKTAADKTIPPLYSDLATLMSVRLALSGDAKDQDAAALLAKLQPLLAKGNPWRWHAHIEAALIAAHLQNDYAAARAQLAPVMNSTDQMPASLQGRARTLDQVFSQKLGALGTVKKDQPATTDAEG